MPRISAYRLQNVGLRYSQEPGASIPFLEILEMAGAPSDILDSPDATIELLHEAGAVETACRVLEDKTFAARVGLSAKVLARFWRISYGRLKRLKMRWH